MCVCVRVYICCREFWINSCCWFQFSTECVCIYVIFHPLVLIVTAVLWLITWSDSFKYWYQLSNSFKRGRQSEDSFFFFVQVSRDQKSIYTLYWWNVLCFSWKILSSGSFWSLILYFKGWTESIVEKESWTAGERGTVSLNPPYFFYHAIKS